MPKIEPYSIPDERVVRIIERSYRPPRTGPYDHDIRWETYDSPASHSEHRLIGINAEDATTAADLAREIHLAILHVLRTLNYEPPEAGTLEMRWDPEADRPECYVVALFKQLQLVSCFRLSGEAIHLQESAFMALLEGPDKLDDNLVCSIPCVSVNGIEAEQALSGLIQIHGYGDDGYLKEGRDAALLRKLVRRPLMRPTSASSRSFSKTSPIRGPLGTPKTLITSSPVRRRRGSSGILLTSS
jgi:hypothetical protein